MTPEKETSEKPGAELKSVVLAIINLIPAPIALNWIHAILSRVFMRKTDINMKSIDNPSSLSRKTDIQLSSNLRTSGRQHTVNLSGPNNLLKLLQTDTLKLLFLPNPDRNEFSTENRSPPAGWNKKTPRRLFRLVPAHLRGVGYLIKSGSGFLPGFPALFKNRPCSNVYP